MKYIDYCPICQDYVEVYPGIEGWMCMECGADLDIDKPDTKEDYD